MVEKNNVLGHWVNIDKNCDRVIFGFSIQLLKEDTLKVTIYTAGFEETFDNGKITEDGFEVLYEFCDDMANKYKGIFDGKNMLVTSSTIFKDSGRERFDQKGQYYSRLNIDVNDSDGMLKELNKSFFSEFAKSISDLRKKVVFDNSQANLKIVGHWVHEDPNTNSYCGISLSMIEGGKLYIAIYGKCSPFVSDTEWDAGVITEDGFKCKIYFGYDKEDLEGKLKDDKLYVWNTGYTRLDLDPTDFEGMFSAMKEKFYGEKKINPKYNYLENKTGEEQSVEKFLGHFINIDPKTNSWIGVTLRLVEGNKIKSIMYGKCHPSWSEVESKGIVSKIGLEIEDDEGFCVRMFHAIIQEKKLLLSESTFYRDHRKERTNEQVYSRVDGMEVEDDDGIAKIMKEVFYPQLQLEYTYIPNETGEEQETKKFIGHWVNTDSKSRDIIGYSIRTNEDKILVRLYNKSYPSWEEEEFDTSIVTNKGLQLEAYFGDDYKAKINAIVQSKLLLTSSNRLDDYYQEIIKNDETYSYLESVDANDFEGMKKILKEMFYKPISVEPEYLKNETGEEQSIEKFIGHWVHIDPNYNGWIGLTINDNVGNKVEAKLFGRCSPVWSERKVDGIISNIGMELEEDSGWCRRKSHGIIQKNRLFISEITVYTDNSGRETRNSKCEFYRLEGADPKNIYAIYGVLKEVYYKDDNININTVTIDTGNSCSICKKELNFNVSQFYCFFCKLYYCESCGNLRDSSKEGMLQFVDRHNLIFIPPLANHNKDTLTVLIKRLGKSKATELKEFSLSQNYICNGCNGSLDTGYRFICLSCKPGLTENYVDYCANCLGILLDSSHENHLEMKNLALSKDQHDVTSHIYLRICFGSGFYRDY